jgi:antitoxin CptB
MSEADRVRWQCRRGLLELDLVLAAFVERHLERLDARQIELFEELLDQPDNDLLDLVMGRAEPVDQRCKPVLDLLRANGACAAASGSSSDDDDVMDSKISENRRLQ